MFSCQGVSDPKSRPFLREDHPICIELNDTKAPIRVCDPGSNRFGDFLEKLFEKKINSFYLLPMFDDMKVLKGIAAVIKRYDPPIMIEERDHEYSLQYFSPIVLRAISISLSFERSKKHGSWLKKHNNVSSDHEVYHGLQRGKWALQPNPVAKEVHLHEAE